MLGFTFVKKMKTVAHLEIKIFTEIEVTQENQRSTSHNNES